MHAGGALGKKVLRAGGGVTAAQHPISFITCGGARQLEVAFEWL
jgi:hypothetical protein